MNTKYRFTLYYTVGEVNPTVHSTTCYAETAEIAQNSCTIPLPASWIHRCASVGTKLKSYDDLTDRWDIVTETGQTG